MVLFGGIDPSGSAAKPSACAVMDEKFQIVGLGFKSTDREIAGFFNPYKHKLYALGLDGPCCLPVGLYLCCFQQDGSKCIHEQPDGLKGRACERELAKRGIGCFFTVKKAFARGWIIRSEQLYKMMSQAGYSVLEVYPYASKRILFGRHIPKKSTKAGRRWLQERLARLSITFPEEQLYSHHELDAIVAALTVWLHYRGKTEEVGDDIEGRIVLPSARATKQLVRTFDSI